jgi:hypothetical protein
MTRRHDSRLVGAWLMERGSPAAREEAHRQSVDDRIRELRVWVFDSNGNGRQYSFEDWSSGTETFLIFRWRTKGDRLWMKWGAPGSSLGAVHEIIDDFCRDLRGQPHGIPQHEYLISAVQEPVPGAKQFVLHSQNPRHVPPNDVVFLKLIERE